MVKNLISKGKRIFFSEQTSVLSAASVIMVMILASQVLSFIRNRIILYFFTPRESSLFFAAFRLPDLVFEVFVFGIFSSAFIPVFTKTIQKNKAQAWNSAARIVNLGLIVFSFFAVVIGIWADDIYKIIAPGFSPQEIAIVADLARILFLAQCFFVISYVLTGVLESLRRFLVPALAPIFYNLGLILGTITLSPHLGLLGPAIGVVIGSFIHFIVQFPLAYKLGFRFSGEVNPDKQVKQVAKLAAPRLIDLSFQQVASTVELYLASLISTASYSYFVLANSLQVAPVRLFGTSLAKAALPTLTRQEKKPQEFKNTLFLTLNQVFFWVMPIVAIFVAVRIPTVRLAFGTKIFDWEATVQTGIVLSVFAIGIPFQAAIALLGRAFYALRDTKTPVTVSVIGDGIVVVLDFILVRGFGLPLWALAFSFSLGRLVETLILVYLLKKKLKNFTFMEISLPFLKNILAAFSSGLVMYFLLKIFDKSVWVKKLSFINSIDASKIIPFQKFVLDTRYTSNLFFLTLVVSILGFTTYIVVSLILGSREIQQIILIPRKLVLGQRKLSILEKEPEIVSPSTKDTSNS